MSTVKTTITRHRDVTDLLLFGPDAEYPQVTKVGDESALWEWLSKVRSDGDDHTGSIGPIRCRDTGDIVGLDTSYSDAPVVEECRHDHWLLVHCVIETGMEVMHP